MSVPYNGNEINSAAQTAEQTINDQFLENDSATSEQQISLDERFHVIGGIATADVARDEQIESGDEPTVSEAVTRYSRSGDAFDIKGIVEGEKPLSKAELVLRLHDYARQCVRASYGDSLKDWMAPEVTLPEVRDAIKAVADGTANTLVLGRISLGKLNINARRWLNVSTYDDQYGPGSAGRAIMREQPVLEDLNFTRNTLATRKAHASEQKLGRAAVALTAPHPNSLAVEPQQPSQITTRQALTQEPRYTFDPHRYNPMTGEYYTNGLSPRQRALLLKEVQNRIAGIVLREARENHTILEEDPDDPVHFVTLAEAIDALRSLKNTQGSKAVLRKLGGVALGEMNPLSASLKLSNPAFDKRYGIRILPRVLKLQPNNLPGPSITPQARPILLLSHKEDVDLEAGMMLTEADFAPSEVRMVWADELKKNLTDRQVMKALSAIYHPDELDPNTYRKYFTWKANHKNRVPVQEKIALHRAEGLVGLQNAVIEYMTKQEQQWLLANQQTVGSKLATPPTLAKVKEESWLL